MNLNIIVIENLLSLVYTRTEKFKLQMYWYKAKIKQILIKYNK